MLKRKKQAGNTEPLFQGGAVYSDKEMERFFASRKNVKELTAPLGIQPNPLDYMIVEDNGVSLYTMACYIHKLPRKSTFATTYAPLFNFPNVTGCVFINPVAEGKSSALLDRRITSLEAECAAAAESGDRNKYRRMNEKMSDAEHYARSVEIGDNQLYDVAFLFVLQLDSLDGLRMQMGNFHMMAREKGIELHACYSVHPEAFVSGYPTNRIFTASAGLLKDRNVIKRHKLDKHALVDIFNHTHSGFSHKNGILAGHNLVTGQPVTYDVYDSSHDGYGVVICGKTHSGKSATVKMWLSRFVDFDYKIRSVDFEARGSRGEYSIMAEAVGGVNYQISASSRNILNPFEIDAENEFDETTNTEYRALHLAAKKVDLLHLIMTLVKNGKEIENFSNAVFMDTIVLDAVTDLYQARGILDDDVESLYTDSRTIVNGNLQSGRVRKQMPTLTDFYMHVLKMKASNQNPLYDESYEVILAAMKDYVRELYYCPHCLHFFTRSSFQALPEAAGGKRVCPECGGRHTLTEIHGAKRYFDGQSTVHADADTPHINIDISQLPEKERIAALLIVLDFMQENYFKRNSANPKKAHKVVMLVDELHKTFPYTEARRFIESLYRTARKRHVSPWTVTQALRDFDGYDETKAIVKNATTILLLKQDRQDRGFLAEHTPLTASQMERVFTLGGDLDDPQEKDMRRGEICMIENSSRVVFLKVDYLTASESRIIETDINKIRRMYEGGLELPAP